MVLTTITPCGVICVMELKTHLKTLSLVDRESLALKSETSVGHLQNVAYGYRPCSPELAVLLERNTDKAVTRRDLRPDDWLAIWPELERRKSERRAGGAA